MQGRNWPPQWKKNIMWPTHSVVHKVHKAPRLSISILIWILSSDTTCQLKQFNTNSEAAMLSNTEPQLNSFGPKKWRGQHHPPPPTELLDV